MKVLLSGFEPFDNLIENPSQLVLEALEKDKEKFGLTTIILPVSFSRAFPLLKETIERTKPDYVLCLGLALNRQEITPERIAINWVEARIPDNDGDMPINERISSRHGDGIFSTLPIKAMIEACQKEGVPSTLSNTAGTYVCNYLMFQLLAYAQDKNFRAGFIHLPPTPTLCPLKKGMKVEDMKRGLSAMIQTLGFSSDESSFLNHGQES